jgi:hypothetical protein
MWEEEHMWGQDPCGHGDTCGDGRPRPSRRPRCIGPPDLDFTRPSENLSSLSFREVPILSVQGAKRREPALSEAEGTLPHRRHVPNPLAFRPEPERQRRRSGGTCCFAFITSAPDVNDDQEGHDFSRASNTSHPSRNLGHPERSRRVPTLRCAGEAAQPVTAQPPSTQLDGSSFPKSQ